MKDIDMKIWYEIDVECDEHSIVTREADPTDRWDADDISHSITPTGFRARVFEGDYVRWSTSVPFEPEFNKYYYLLVVYHGDGDSFHHEEGLMRVIDLYQTREEALVAAKQIEAHQNSMDPDYENKHHVEVTFSDGVTRRTSTYDWTGYFSGFERTEIFALQRSPL